MPLETRIERTMSIGAERAEGGAHFRVWAPKRKSVSVVLDDGAEHALSAATDGGYFSGIVPDVPVGVRYRFRLDDDQRLYPDPASRFQPEGVHGPSELVDPSTYSWGDSAWPGLPSHGHVIYELHIGCFTPEGTWASAAEKLNHLKDLGVTIIEVMPVHAFPGKRNWGYDGVDLFAPTENYGPPDDFRRFVDRAHGLGIGVILDVVYNHFGPDGNYLTAFSDVYFTDKHANDWGASLNFDGEQSKSVRQFFIENAAYWIREFHLDGIRFDATQAIIDASPTHILQEIGVAARAASERLRAGRRIFLVNENEPQDSRLIRTISNGGMGLDASWNDDFHHTVRVALTGRRDAYYTDYHGTIQELISAVKWGYLYQGQFYSWQQQRRGTPSLDLPHAAYVHYIQNHDQIANFGNGERISHFASPALIRAITTMLLLAPQPPMLFMGQEWFADTRFLYFSDHGGELPEAIRAGRAEELSQFPSLSSPEVAALMADPSAESTFLASKLNWNELNDRHHQESLALHRDLLHLRRTDPVFSKPIDRGTLDASVIQPRSCVFRFFSRDHGDRVLILNLDGEQHLSIVPEPLLAPPAGCEWQTLFCSEDPQYGGHGCVPPETRNEYWRLPGENWRLPGHCALVMRARPASGRVERTSQLSPNERRKELRLRSQSNRGTDAPA